MTTGRAFGWWGKEGSVTQTKITPRFTPVGNRLLVERVPADEITAGGVLIPVAAQEDRRVARVLKLGGGLSDEFTNVVEQGSLVLYSPFAGIMYEEVEHTDDMRRVTHEYVVLIESDVLGTIDDA